MSDREPVPDLLDALRDEAVRDGGAPDLTGRVMGRLGYMRSAPAVRTRRRRRRAIARGLAACSAIGLLVLVSAMLDAAGRTRAPEGPTIGEAVGRDLAVRRAEFAGTFAGLRRIGERLAPGAGTTTNDEAASTNDATTVEADPLPAKPAPEDALGPVSRRMLAGGPVA